MEAFLPTWRRRKAFLTRLGVRGVRGLSAALGSCFFSLLPAAPARDGCEPGKSEGPRAAAGLSRLRAEDFFPAEPGMRWVYDGWGNEFAAYTRTATHRRGQRAQIVHVSGAIVVWVYDIHPDRIVLRALRSEIENEMQEYLDEPDELAWVILQEPLVEGARWRTPTFRQRTAKTLSRGIPLAAIHLSGRRGASRASAKR